MSSILRRYLAAPKVTEAPTEAVEAEDDAPAIDVDWAAAKLAVDRISECLRAIRMQLAGVSGQGVRRLREPFRDEESGNTVLHIEVPGGEVTLLVAEGGLGSACIRLDEVPPTPASVQPALIPIEPEHEEEEGMAHEPVPDDDGEISDIVGEDLVLFAHGPVRLPEDTGHGISISD